MAGRTRKAPAKPASKRAKASPARRARAARAGGARKRLTARGEARGIAAADAPLAMDAPELAPLVAAVRAAGGAPLGAYREPFAGRPLLLAALPRDAVEPTPFQRDLSPTHAKRLARKIEETGSFLDPIIVVRGDGGFWTPNGRHRLAAARVLGLRQLTALVSPDEELAFRILALNTEKAHNLRDRSLEAIRMARALAARDRKARELDFSAQLEAPELLTLGIVYEREPRFAGGAYAPFLRKLDRFAEGSLAASLRQRGDWAARLVAIDGEVKRIVRSLEGRGFRSPYLRSFVVARLNPVRFHKAKPGESQPPMPLSEALTRMMGAARKFDAAGVRERDLALVAAVAAEADG
jgi:ParB family chromosome partitioning protein